MSGYIWDTIIKCIEAHEELPGDITKHLNKTPGGVIYVFIYLLVNYLNY